MINKTSPVVAGAVERRVMRGTKCKNIIGQNCTGMMEVVRRRAGFFPCIENHLPLSLGCVRVSLQDLMLDLSINPRGRQVREHVLHQVGRYHVPPSRAGLCLALLT